MPALVTPYTATGEVNETSLRSLVSRCLEKGVSGFYACGSSAEAFMLTTAERKRILEVVADENAGRVALIAHVGAVGTDQSIELGLHAKSVGVDAVSSVPPFYYSFTQDEVVGHYLAIVEAVEMPLILYNFPAYSGFTVTPELVNRLRRKSPHFIGIKQTSSDLYELEQMVAIAEDFFVLSGRDEVLAGALALGADGAIGSTFNLIPEFYVQMMDAFAKGETEKARQLQVRVNRFIGLMKNGTGLPQLKAGLDLVGIECNGCRKPIQALAPDELQSIKQTLSDIGVI